MRRLDCADCHVPTLDGSMMQPISFEQHCKECHKFNFETAGTENFALLLGAEGLPHEKPGLIRAFVRDRLTAAVISGRTPQPAPAPALAPLKYAPVREQDRLSDDEQVKVEQALQEFEDRLFNTPGAHQQPDERPLNGEALLKTTCRHCHNVEPVAEVQAGDVPWKIRPPSIPELWQPHAVFRHDRHDAFTTCTDCHYRKASQDGRPPKADDPNDSIHASQFATDILIPSIEACKNCHGSASAASVTHPASANCVDCHQYHHTQPQPQHDPPVNFFRDLSAD